MQKIPSNQNDINNLLFKAISENDKDIIKDLIAKGADVNFTQKYQIYDICTCLYKALCEGYIDIAEILIKSGADVNFITYLSPEYQDVYYHPIEALVYSNQNMIEGIKLIIKNELEVNSLAAKKAFLALCRNVKENKSDQVESCKALIRAGIDINWTTQLNEIDSIYNNVGGTALYQASISGNTCVVKLLIENGAERNLASCFVLDDYEGIEQIRGKSDRLMDNEAYIFCQAACSKNTKLMSKMIKFGISVNITYTDYAGRVKTPFTSAYDEATRLWLLQNGADLNLLLNTAGLNSLCNAAIADEVELFKLLLAAGANPDERWSDHTKTPVLHTAVSHYLPFEKSKLLLFAGANVHAEDHLQQTAMHAIANNILDEEGGKSFYSSAQEKLDTIDLLLLYKASPNPKDIRGNTPLHLASRRGCSPIILDKLIEIGNNINDKNFYGETALTLAAINGKKKTAEYLLSKGAKLDLTASICFNKISIILKELENIESIDILDHEYNTLLHYAVKRGFSPVVKKLIEKGIKINAFNALHQTALDLAINNDHKAIAEYLQMKGGKPYLNLSNNNLDCHCGYWIPKKEGEHIISYSLEGVPKKICNKYYGFYESYKVTRSQRKLVLKVFEYVSSVFKIKFLEIENSAEADLIIGQSPNELGGRYYEVTLQKENNWIISKASITINKYDLNESKIKYYPNYSFAKILQCLGQVLGLSLPKDYHSRLSDTSIMNNFEEGIRDKDYKTKFLEDDLIMLSSRYNFAKNYLAQITELTIQDARNIDKEIALNKAIKANDTGRVKQLIIEGAELNIPIKFNDKDLIYPLSEAILNNNEQMVQSLIEAGAQVNIIRDGAHTALDDACSVGAIKIVQILLKAGADPNFYGVNNSGLVSLPLQTAIFRKHIDICKVLLDAKAKTNISLNLFKNKSIISLAALYGNVDILKLFYKKGMKIDLVTAFMLNMPEKISSIIKEQNIPKKKLEWLLGDAADNRNSDLAKALVDYGVPVDINRLNSAITIMNGIDVVQVLAPHVTNINQYLLLGTVLHHAARYSVEEIVSILLKYGADPNLKDQDGYNALHLAILNIKRLNINSLIKSGVNINATDKNGNTALHLAASSKELFRYAEILMLSGADVNVRNAKNKTVLHLAIEHNYEGWIVELFKTFGGDLNPQLANPNHHGYIDFALNCSNYKVIPNLLIHGVKYSLISAIKLDLRTQVHEMLLEEIDMDTTDTDGNTPLHLAALKGYLDIAAEIVLKGGKLNTFNKKNQTALDMAQAGRETVYDYNKPMITYLISRGAQTAKELEHIRKIVGSNRKIQSIQSDMTDFEVGSTIH